MARIRSVHPSLFTDEAWVSCSPLARLLYIGLWTDADDQGVFEWKPLQIKMRLLPGDTADAPALLAELSDAGLVAAFDAGGKRYGAIKLFRKYQRPKKPNALHPLPPEWREYVHLGDASSEPDGDDDDAVPNRFPTEGEKCPQMEDGGEEVSKPPKPPEGAFDHAWQAYPESGKATTSIPQSRDAWEPAAAEVGEGALLAAVRRFSASPVVRGAKAKSPPAFHRWLAGRRWEAWLEPDKPRPASAVPAAVREAFLPLGEGWCGSYLDHCAWQDVPERALIPATRFAGEKIVKDGRAILKALGLSVLEKAA